MSLRSLFPTRIGLPAKGDRPTKIATIEARDAEPLGRVTQDILSMVYDRIVEHLKPN